MAWREFGKAQAHRMLAFAFFHVDSSLLRRATATRVSPGVLRCMDWAGVIAVTARHRHRRVSGGCGTRRGWRAYEGSGPEVGL